jgi:single-strand DNA-binding protein
MLAINRVQLLGNLGRAPEILTFSSGSKAAVLSVAVSERWKDRQSGETKERTDWIRAVVWGALVGPVEKFYKKGDRVYLEGNLRRREYEKDGEKRYTYEVLVSSTGTIRLVDGKTAAAENATLPEDEAAPEDITAELAA